MRIKSLFVASCSFFCLTDVSEASLNLNAVGVATTVNFDTTVAGVNNGAFAGGGFQTTPTSGQLNSDSWAVTGWSDGDLAFGGTKITANTDYTRGFGAGNPTAGGIYGFDVDPSSAVNRALGVQPVATEWNPGTLTLRLQNATGSTISSLALAYTVYIRNNENRASTFNFLYSSDGVSFNPVPSLNLTSTASADLLGFVANPLSTSLTGLSIANGGLFYLQWRGADAVGGTGSRDEFALDDISITAAAVPEPSTFIAGALLALPFGVQGVRYLRNRKRA